MPMADVSDLRGRLQGDLFPWLARELGSLTEKLKLLVGVLEMAPIDAFLVACPGLPGRPPADRVALARAFVAKSVLNIPTTALLIERLRSDRSVRWICGWDRSLSVPSEATFSRAFAEFSATALPARLHEALIVHTQKDRLIGHVARDATSIEVRETPVKVEPAKRWRKQQLPEKGCPEYEGVRRIERQQSMTLDEMLADLPLHCAVGIKPNSKGKKSAWIGYKLHIDTIDGDIPVTAVLTSASLHDSQVALPLAQMTARRVTSLYDLMDSAYDAPEIHAASRALGHVPIIKSQARRGQKDAAATEALARTHANFQSAEDVRFNARTSAERVNARLKEEFGGRSVRVRGHAKVMCHLMFGMLVLAADQVLRLVT